MHKLLLCTQCFSLSPHPLLSDYTPCSCSWGLQCKPPRLSQAPTLQTPSARRWGWTGARPPGKGHRAGADGTGMTGMILSEWSCPVPFHQPGSRCCSWERGEQTKMLSERMFLPLLIDCAPHEQQSTTRTERDSAKTVIGTLPNGSQGQPDWKRHNNVQKLIMMTPNWRKIGKSRGESVA